MSKCLVSPTRIDEVVQKHALQNSLSEHLGCEHRICFLNILHLSVQFLIVSDHTDAPVESCLDFDETQTEHGQGSVGVAGVALGALEGLSNVLQNINVTLLTVCCDLRNIVFYTKEVCKKHAFSLEG